MPSDRRSARVRARAMAAAPTGGSSANRSAASACPPTWCWCTRSFVASSACCRCWSRASARRSSQRAAVLAAHARELATALRHHHGAEQDLLWPRLRERAPLDSGGRGADGAPGNGEHAGAAARAGRRCCRCGSRRPDTDLRDIADRHPDRTGRAADRRISTRRSNSVLPAVDEHFTTGRMAGARAARRELDPAEPDGVDARRDARGRHRGRAGNLHGARCPAPARLLYRMVGQEQYVKGDAGAAGVGLRSSLNGRRPEAGLQVPRRSSLTLLIAHSLGSRPPELFGSAFLASDELSVQKSSVRRIAVDSAAPDQSSTLCLVSRPPLGAGAMTASTRNVLGALVPTDASATSPTIHGWPRI